MPQAPVSVALVSTHGVVALRAALHRLRDSAAGDVEVIVLAAQHHDDVLDYLSRQYLRGEVAAVALEARAPEMAHCGIDTAFPLASGEIVVRVQDDLAFAPGWLDAVGAALRGAPDIGLLGLVREPEPRRRGRPPKTRTPEAVDEVDLRAFAASSDVLRLHAAELAGERCAVGCRFQGLLRQRGYRLAYLAGQVAAAARESLAPTGTELEADLAFHPGAREAMARLRQSYALGDVVLTPCGACDDDELEVLAVQIDFCAAHGVPLGHTYTMRCTGCHALRFEEDHEFRCPA
jgi:hypothetical protein